VVHAPLPQLLWWCRPWPGGWIGLSGGSKLPGELLKEYQLTGLFLYNLKEAARVRTDGGSESPGCDGLDMKSLGYCTKENV